MTDATPSPPELLAQHRSEIDRLDSILVNTLAERFRYTRMIGRLKAEHDLPSSDPEREAKQLKRLQAQSRGKDLNPEFVKSVFTLTFEEVIRNHEQFRE